MDTKVFFASVQVALGSASEPC